MSTNTVFVIGAGASKSVGLPTGAELTALIEQQLRFRFRSHELISGDQDILDALRVHGAQTGIRDLNQYAGAAHSISAAMPTSSSIDSFIATREGDALIETVGKIAIAHNILREERKSALFLEDKNSYEPGLDISSSRHSWHNQLFKILNRGLKPITAHKLFDDCSFIVFNYDRCFEHYLFHAIQNYFSASKEEADEIVRDAPIIHPYGTPGSSLPSAGQERVRFGEDLHPNGLVEAAGRIRTYGEEIADEKKIKAMRRKIQSAKRLVFLGFGFHTQNIKLMAAPASRLEEIYSTDIGVSKTSITIARERLDEALAPSLLLTDFEYFMGGNKDSEALLSEYGDAF